ncbi:MAG: O-antigen ligase family protein [Candidatus Falkowbacteria bacterium]
MTESKPNKEAAAGRLKLIFLALGLYSLFSIILSFIWPGSSLGLIFLLVALAIFVYSLFDLKIGFLALLVLRTTFDSLGTQELINISGISIDFTFVLGMMLIGLAVLAVILKWSKLKNLPLRFPWLSFLGILAVLSFFSFSKSASAVDFFRLLSFFSAFVFGYLIYDTPKKLTFLIKTIIFSAIIPASVAWYQLLTRGGFFDGDRWRLMGTFVHPNMLAFYLVLVICLSLFVSLNLKKGVIEKIPYALLAIFFVVALLFTYTRAAWLALALILFGIGIYRFRKLLFISILAAAVLYLFAPFFQDRVSTLMTLGASDSSTWRLDLWRDIWSFIKASPWFGYGPGTASIFIQNNIPRFLVETEPHNDYLRVWLESGIFALLAFVWIFMAYLKNMWLGFKLEARPRLKMLILFLFFFTISLLAASATDNILKDAVMQWIFWSLSGSLLMIISIHKIKKEPLK